MLASALPGEGQGVPPWRWQLGTNGPAGYRGNVGAPSTCLRWARAHARRLHPSGDLRWHGTGWRSFSVGLVPMARTREQVFARSIEEQGNREDAMNRGWLLPALAPSDGPAHTGARETEV